MHADDHTPLEHEPIGAGFIQPYPLLLCGVFQRLCLCERYFASFRLMGTDSVQLSHVVESQIRPHDPAALPCTMKRSGPGPVKPILTFLVEAWITELTDLCPRN